MQGKPRVSKSELVRTIYFEQDLERLGITQKFVLEDVFDIFIENIADALVRGEPVYLRGFGTFSPIRHNLTKRMSYVPRNEEFVETIVLNHGAVFRPSHKLIRKVNIGAEDVFAQYFNDSDST